MTLPEERPTIPERYAKAISADHLEAQADQKGPVDLLIAAGWCRTGLGTLLYRLRSEYDAVRSEHRAALRSLHAIDETRRALLRRAGEANCPHDAEKLRAQAQVISDLAAMDAMSNRMLILGHMKTLPAGQRAMLNFVGILALQKKIVLEPSEVDDLSERVLSAWLDPICPHCCGRGFNGGYTEPMVMCSGPGRCGGTGRRSPRLANAEPVHQLGRYALSEMDRKTDKVTQQMRKFLRSLEGAE